MPSIYLSRSLDPNKKEPNWFELQSQKGRLTIRPVQLHSREEMVAVTTWCQEASRFDEEKEAVSLKFIQQLMYGLLIKEGDQPLLISINDKPASLLVLHELNDKPNLLAIHNQLFAGYDLRKRRVYLMELYQKCSAEERNTLSKLYSKSVLEWLTKKCKVGMLYWPIDTDDKDTQGIAKLYKFQKWEVDYDTGLDLFVFTDHALKK